MLTKKLVQELVKAALVQSGHKLKANQMLINEEINRGTFIHIVEYYAAILIHNCTQ